MIGVILHGGTHLACDFPRISTSDHSIFRQTIASRFGYHQPSYIEILATTEAATGIAMVILMAIIFSLATKWPRRQSPTLPRSVRQVTGYNTFWYSHHLLILVYALLIVHSMFLFLTSNLIEKTVRKIRFNHSSFFQFVKNSFQFTLRYSENVTGCVDDHVYRVPGAAIHGRESVPSRAIRSLRGQDIEGSMIFQVHHKLCYKQNSILELLLI